MEKSLYDILKTRFETAKTDRSKYENTLGECGRYIWPNMSNVIFEMKNDGGDMVKMVDIYDSTPIEAADMMAKGILGNMMPVGIRWFEFSPKDEKLNDDEEIKMIASEKTDQAHRILWESNFVSKVYMCLRSMIVFTFGTIGYNKNDKSFSFYPIRDILFEVNSRGVPDTVFRRMSFTARQARQEFGNADLGKKVTKAEKEGESDKFNFVHCVFPNSDYDGKYGSKKYASKILNLDDGQLIESDKYKNGYSYLPYKIVLFEDNYDSDNIGYSPSIESLPDIKMLNEAKRVFIESCDKESNRPLIIEDDSVIGQPVTSAGGLIVIRRNAKEPKALDTGSNPQLNQAFISDLQQGVRKTYMADVFDSMNYYRQETAAELKEMEIEKRINEGYVLLIPTVVSIQKFLLEPLIMEILDEIGDDGIKFKIIYQGRLSLAMNSMQTNAIETHLAKWEPYDEKWNIFDNTNMDDAYRISGLNTGVPAKLFKDKDDVADQREARNAPQQAMADATIASEAARAYKDIAGTL